MRKLMFGAVLLAAGCGGPSTQPSEKDLADTQAKAQQQADAEEKQMQKELRKR
jgi:hypothetical protein